MAYSETKLTTVADLKALANKVNTKKADKAATLAGYNIGDAYTKTEVDNKIGAQIGAAYKPAGSVAFANLPAITAALAGSVYNITDAFVTTNQFVEGAGKSFPAGTDVGIVEIPAAEEGEDPTYAYNVLSGFVDLSNYVEKETNKSLVDNGEIEKLTGVSNGANKVEASATTGKIKIDGAETTIFEVSTTAETTEMLNEIFGE